MPYLHVALDRLSEARYLRGMRLLIHTLIAAGWTVSSPVAAREPGPVEAPSASFAPPAKGTGMLAAGGVLLGLATIAGGTAIYFGTRPVAPDPGFHDAFDAVGNAVGAISFGVSATVLFAVGAPLLAVGGYRRHHYNTWLGQQARLTPTFAPTRGGASLGLTLRF